MSRDFFNQKNFGDVTKICEGARPKPPLKIFHLFYWTQK